MIARTASAPNICEGLFWRFKEVQPDAKEGLVLFPDGRAHKTKAEQGETQERDSGTAVGDTVTASRGETGRGNGAIEANNTDMGRD